MGRISAKEAGMSSSSIEAFYAARAAREPLEPENQTANPCEEQPLANDPIPDGILATSDLAKHNARKVLKAMSSSNASAAAILRFTSMVQNAVEDAKQAIGNTIEVAKRAMFEIGKQIGHWARQHPRAMASIVVTIVLLSCTPVILGAIGFTSGGVLAGSIAAGIQAGIGSVSAGSLFATLTSCAMGGYGVAIVASGAVGIGVTIVGAIIGWTKWKDTSNDEDDDSAAGSDGALLKIKED